MSSIRKRYLIVDRKGRPLASETERLTDNQAGQINFERRKSALWCSGCRRPVESLSELRGRCDCCRRQGICSKCEVKCRTCSRRMCFACRRGFAGRTPMTVCPECLFNLRLRQDFEDRQTIYSRAFQRRLALQREWARTQGIRMQAARIRAAQQVRKERIRAANRMAMLREVNRLRLKLARSRTSALRHLH
jgi:hypothetical protein